MSIYNEVKKFIDNQQDGEIFTANDIRVSPSKRQQVNNALSKLSMEDYIERLSKGKYYKPRQTKFGIVKPSDEKVISKVIETIYKKTKTKPYLASNSIFQKLGLTTQVSSEIFLVCNTKVSYDFKIKNLKFNLIKYEGQWKAKDIQYFEFLYALKNIKKIPDTTIDESYKKLMYMLENFSSNEIMELSNLSKYFNNTTRALLGSMFDQLSFSIAVKVIKKTLHPKTNYYIDLSDEAIPKLIKIRWRIYEATRK